MPPVAYEPWDDIRWRDDIAALNLSFPYGYMPKWYAKKIRQSYYAATSYVDSLIGDLLGALDMYGFGDDTIVSFIGDHGTTMIIIANIQSCHFDPRLSLGRQMCVLHLTPQAYLP